MQKKNKIFKPFIDLLVRPEKFHPAWVGGILFCVGVVVLVFSTTKTWKVINAVQPANASQARELNTFEINTGFRYGEFIHPVDESQFEQASRNQQQLNQKQTQLNKQIADLSKQYKKLAAEMGETTDTPVIKKETTKETPPKPCPT